MRDRPRPFPSCYRPPAEEPGRVASVWPLVLDSVLCCLIAAALYLLALWGG